MSFSEPPKSEQRRDRDLQSYMKKISRAAPNFLRPERDQRWNNNLVVLAFENSIFMLVSEQSAHWHGILKNYVIILVIIKYEKVFLFAHFINIFSKTT